MFWSILWRSVFKVNHQWLIYYILQAEKIEKLIKAAKVEIEPFWPGLFAKALEGHSLDSLIQSAGAPGAGGAAPAAGGAAAGGGEAEAKEEEKKEEKKEEEEEESDDDMGFGELLNLVQFCTKQKKCSTWMVVEGFFGLLLGVEDTVHL